MSRFPQGRDSVQAREGNSGWELFHFLLVDLRLSKSLFWRLYGDLVHLLHFIDLGTFWESFPKSRMNQQMIHKFPWHLEVLSKYLYYLFRTGGIYWGVEQGGAKWIRSREEWLPVSTCKNVSPPQRSHDIKFLRSRKLIAVIPINGFLAYSLLLLRAGKRTERKEVAEVQYIEVTAPLNKV